VNIVNTQTISEEKKNIAQHVLRFLV